MTSQFKLFCQACSGLRTARAVAAVLCLFLVFTLMGLGGLMPMHGAWAETEAAPAPLFELHCAGCHPSGGNIIRRGKNLKQRALARHGYDEVGAIATLITHGKGLMSAFGDKLSPEEIQALSQYVLDQAAVNWR